MSIRIALFGQPRVLSADGSREFPLPRKTLNVLAHLILNRKRPATRDSVAFALFPDEDEEKARGSLRRNLSYLLSALPDGKQFVIADAERLAWNADAPAHVDVIAFEEAVRAGNDDVALAEYAGQLLPTLYDEWTTADRERLRDAYHEVLLRTIARERSQRRFDVATATAHRLLDEDPWREDVVRQLIAIRYEAGDRAGALAAFERFAARLREEMQAEPMPETTAVRDAVLRGARLATSEPRRSDVAPDAAVDVALPFVGREAPMRLARERWHEAADGHSGVLLIAGEAGAGKSRFVTELARLIESEGGSVVRGYTPAGGEHRPYEAFVEALAGTPELLDDQLGAALTDDRSARLRLFDSVRRRLSDASRRRVLAVVLEDLHWAGAATIDLLEFVARRLEREPILVVATFRDDELPRAHPLRALRRQLQSRGGTTELVLDRLNAHDAAFAMRAALSETAADETTIARAVAWADGIPLLLDEAMRDLAGGRVSNAPDIDALVAERFVRLSPNAETALVFGAVLGERFELNALAAVTGWRDGEILDAVGEGIESGLIRATSRAPGMAFAFRHDLIRVAATQRIPEGERMRAHGLIARALAAQSDDTGARAGEIARHFAAAGESQRAAEHYLRAASYALGVYANEDACEIATVGLTLCDEGDPAQRRLRYDLIAHREQALERMGASDRRRADARALVSLARGDEEATTAWERVFAANHEDDATRAEALEALASLARSLPRASRTFLYLSARDANIRGDYSKAREFAIQASDAFAAAGELRASMLARFSLLVSLKVLAANEEAVRTIDELRPVMDASDDLAMRAEFHRVASSALYEMTLRETALEDARRSLSLALRIGDRYAEARARQNIAVQVARAGNYEESFVQQELALEGYRELGNEEGVADSIINLGAWRAFCGDFAGCERILDQFGSLEKQIPLTQLKYFQLRGVLYERMGRSDAERALLETRRRAVALKAVYFEARMNRELAKVAAVQGRLADAVAYIDAAMAVADAYSSRVHEAECLAISARLRAMLGEDERARDEAARAMRLAEDQRMQSHSEIAWNAAVAYALLGDAETAMKLAESAAEGAVRETLGMPADLAEAFLALPWHRDAVDYVWGRPVALGFDAPATTP